MTGQNFTVFRDKIGPLSNVLVYKPEDVASVFQAEGKYPARGSTLPWSIYWKQRKKAKGLLLAQTANIFSIILIQLIALKKKSEPVKVKWSVEADQAFQDLRTCLVSVPVLHRPDYIKPFILQTDASGYALGTILSQIDTNGLERPVAYASRRLLPAEINYATIEKECLAVVWGIETFRIYVEGQDFTVQTDHRPLLWLYRMKNNNQRLMRWALLIRQYSFDVKYKSGKLNGNVYALSRI
ncbi:Retrovirus-related Pol polyprotein from transposon 17.6 [Trichoplax sp. H2]|nr:Retrovirus-related Pol polyprotein from transposon 17.6 [Trichoplax sp. H2]|eukprot:RDD36252.1 Retrovirus-related Pol polyprotein from transposon 17.6 [Trichoplax sp. H2]